MVILSFMEKEHGNFFFMSWDFCYGYNNLQVEFFKVRWSQPYYWYYSNQNNINRINFDQISNEKIFEAFKLIDND